MKKVAKGPIVTITFDISDFEQKRELEIALNAGKLVSAIFEFQNKLRSIRKYDIIENHDATEGASQESIKEAVHYYTDLLHLTLEENGALDLFD